MFYKNARKGLICVKYVTNLTPRIGTSSFTLAILGRKRQGLFNFYQAQHKLIGYDHV